MARTSIRIHPAGLERLKALKAELAAQEGRAATYEEIASALVWGTSAAQASGMLIAFTRANASADADGADEGVGAP